MAWLDHSRFHSSDSLILRIVWDIGRTVKEIVHAVASERLHNGTPAGSGDWLTSESRSGKHTPIDQPGRSHRFPDISDQCSRLADAYCGVQGLSGDTHQLLRVLIDLTHWVGFVQVRVQTLGGMLNAGDRTRDSKWSHHLCRKIHLSGTSVHGRSPF